MSRAPRKIVRWDCCREPRPAKLRKFKFHMSFGSADDDDGIIHCHTLRMLFLDVKHEIMSLLNVCVSVESGAYVGV